MSDDIYREIILDHFRNPRNRGTLDPHDFTYEDVNPLCGSILPRLSKNTRGPCTGTARQNP